MNQLILHSENYKKRIYRLREFSIWKERTCNISFLASLLPQIKQGNNEEEGGGGGEGGREVRERREEGEEDERRGNNGIYSRIKRTSQILRTEHDGDVPATTEELLELPGVGPKVIEK